VARRSKVNEIKAYTCDGQVSLRSGAKKFILEMHRQ
jgi:hypothetical protein